MFDPTTEDAESLFEQAGSESEAGNHGTAAVLYAQAAEAYLRCGNPSMAGQALRNRGSQLYCAGEPTAASEVYAEAAVLAQRDDDVRLQLQCLWGRADSLAALEEWSTVRQVCQTAIPLMRAYNHEELIAEMLLLRARAQYWLDEEADALASAAEAGGVFRGNGDVRGQLRVQDFELMVLLYLQRHDEALQTARRAAALAKSAADRPGEASHRLRLGEVLLAADRPQDAAPHFEWAHGVYRDAGLHGGAGWALTWLGRALAAMGRLTEAVEAFEPAVAALDAAGPQWSWERDLARRRLAGARYDLGHYEQAAAVDELVLGAYRDGSQPLDRAGAESLTRRTSALVHAGRAQEAAQFMQDLAAAGALADFGDRSASFAAASCMAWAQWRCGDRAGALRQALDLLEDPGLLPASLAEAWLLEIVGSAAQPQETDSLARLARAQAIYFECDEFQRLAEVAEAVLERTARS